MKSIKKDLQSEEWYRSLQTVPAELKALKQWVLLKEELRDGKPTKIPYQVDGNRANANDPNTWTDFQTACNHRDRFSDIGFVFSKDDPYCGIYIHDAINVTGWHGNFSRGAGPLCYKLCKVSYGEASLSRNAVKFWTRAKLPDWMNRGKRLTVAGHVAGGSFGPDEIEVYHYGRYFTVTGSKGNEITGEGTGEIKDGQAIVDSIVYLIEWENRRNSALYRQQREKQERFLRQKAQDGDAGAIAILNWMQRNR